MHGADLDGPGISRARRAYGLTSRQLGRLSGVNHNYISLAELGHRRNEHELERLNKALFDLALRLLQQRHADAARD